jgi:integrase/recombinase XerD
MNVKVNLFKRVRTSTGLRCCPVVESANGRIKPHAVIVDGVEARHEEGAYYISWYEGRRVKRLSVGKDPVEARNRRDRKQAELTAKSKGVGVIAERANGHRSVSVAVAEYLAEIKLAKKPKTIAAYTTSLSYFTESCSKLYLDDIERVDMLKFAAFLRDEKELHPRTCWNKFANVMSFVKWCGIHGLVKKNDWPSYTEEVPEIYEQEDLDALLAVCDAEERLWFEFFLGTGMREQEVQHVYWRDVNLRTATVSVKHKPRVWEPKAYKERDIPISDNLVASLKAWKARPRKPCELLFPTAGCNPKLDFLDCLKAAAERAELDPRDFWLHKFRATFATRLLRALNGDFASGQKVLGHSDIDSTMRYWRPADNHAIREAVNRI